MKKILILLLLINLLLTSCLGSSDSKEIEEPFSDDVSRVQADALMGSVKTLFSRFNDGERGSWSTDDNDWIIEKQGPSSWFINSNELTTGKRVKALIEWDGTPGDNGEDDMKVLYVEIDHEIVFDAR